MPSRKSLPVFSRRIKNNLPIPKLEPPVTPTQLSVAFIERFCQGDVPGLGELLCENLQFNGPFLQADSRTLYLESFAHYPPLPADYRILSVTTTGNEVSIFYEYSKPDHSGVIAQWFRCENGCITETRLVFDPNDFL